MDKKELIISGIVVVIAVVVAGVVFAPASDAKFTTIDVLNKGDLGENGTLYVKLTDNEKTSLSNKTLHIKLTDNNGTVVYEDSVKTHATGVAISKLENVSAGDYTLNITFDGDENYTGSSISQKLTIQGGHVEEVVENSTLIEQTLEDAQDSTDSSYSSSSSSSSYSSSSSSYSSSSSSSDDSYDGFYDENGNKMLTEYDENGNVVDPV